MGLILKIIYYKKFHIWADLIQPFDLTAIKKQKNKNDEKIKRANSIHAINPSITSLDSSGTNGSVNSNEDYCKEI